MAGPLCAVADGGAAAGSGTAVAWLRHRPWLSLPLATATVAGLMAVLLLVRLVAEWPAPPGASAAAVAVAPPSHPVMPVPLAELPDLMLLAEPSAGPAIATDATAGLVSGGVGAGEPTPLGRSPPPDVPVVPAELDDIARELHRRRAELLELDAGLALREAAVRAAEADLAAQIDRLEAFQRQLELLVGEAAAEEEERLQQLVKMYESMRAKSAAAIFDRLELPVILAVAKRMREARMAAILAAMDPNRARIVTSELARERELPRLD